MAFDICGKLQLVLVPGIAGLDLGKIPDAIQASALALFEGIF